VRTWIRPLLIAIAAALCFSTSALAQKRVALVVANWGYQNAELPNPKYDAELVKASLEKAGFTVIMALNVNLNDFEAAIDKFVYASQGAEVALFYFAGHGFSTSDDTRSHWLLATDTDFAAKNAYVLHSHADSLERIQGRIVGNATYTLVFVDACRNSLAPAQGQRGGGSRGFEAFDASLFKRSLVVVSTAEGATAADGTPGQGSPFARAFASILPTPGQRIDDAYRAIRDAVSLETNGSQVPEVVRDDLPSGTLTLVKGAGAEPVGDQGGGQVVTDMHLEVAREAWGYLQYSTNAEELRSFAARFSDTEFGALALTRATQVASSSAEQNTIKTAERGRPGTGGQVASIQPNVGLPPAAPTTPAAPTVPSAPPSCPLKLDKASVDEDGVGHFVVVDNCGKLDVISAQYSQWTFAQAASSATRAEFDLDLFAGPHPVTISASDGRSVSFQPPQFNQTGLTKAVITWTGPVELALHALENSADPGSGGDVWRGNPRSRSEAIRQGIGYMSQLGHNKVPGTHFQVYSYRRSSAVRSVDFRVNKAQCDDTGAKIRFSEMRYEDGEPIDPDLKSHQVVAAQQCGQFDVSDEDEKAPRARHLDF
jgi:Caspase domain